MLDEIGKNSACFGKERFAARADALSAVRAQNRRERKASRKRKVRWEEYACPYCSGWHLAGRGR